MKTQLFMAVLFSCFPALVSSTQTQAYSSACSNGHPGIPGSPGLPGPYGRDGAKGEKGERGTKGGKGEVGAQTPSNWKQCVWKKGDERDHGLLQDCLFNKMQDQTTLRVFYSGALRIYNCNSCCKRWFFTFNGAECSGPMPIDGLIYLRSGTNKEPLRTRHIEGYCENVPRGVVRVGFNVGNCAGSGEANAHSVFELSVPDCGGRSTSSAEVKASRQ